MSWWLSCRAERRAAGSAVSRRTGGEECSASEDNKGEEYKESCSQWWSTGRQKQAKRVRAENSSISFTAW